MNISVPKPTLSGFLRFLIYLFILSLLLRTFSGTIPGVDKIRTQLLV